MNDIAPDCYTYHESFVLVMSRSHRWPCLCALIICLFIIIREWGSAVETVFIGQIHGFKARVGIRLSSVPLNLPVLRREDSETSTSGSVLYNPKSIWNRAEPQSLCLISLVATFLNRSEGNPLANLSA